MFVFLIFNNHFVSILKGRVIAAWAARKIPPCECGLVVGKMGWRLAGAA
jgi:hypothetical protein